MKSSKLAGRLALFASIAAFVAAEIARPTQFLANKHVVARGLLVEKQNAEDAVAHSLFAELLDDLPRIHPDADGALHVRRTRDRGTLEVHGWAADPYSGSPGIAVFPIVDGHRIADAPTRYGLPSPAVVGNRRKNSQAGFSITLHSGFAADPSRVAIGLIAADQRGYFQLGPDISPSETNDGVQ